MRSLLVCAVFVLSSCSIATQAALQSEDGVEQPTTTVTELDEWGRYPAIGTFPIEGDCMGFDGTSLPCNTVINVCVADQNGNYETKWHAQTYYCTDESPRFADVCAAVPDEHLEFYSYTREECDTLSGG